MELLISALLRIAMLTILYSNEAAVFKNGNNKKHIK